MKNPYDEDPSVAGLFKFLAHDENEDYEYDDVPQYKGWPAAGPPKDR